jgi:hypothetical protein
MKQKAILSIILAAGTAASAWAGVVTEKPVAKGCPTSFAIVTDRATYDASRPAMLRYRDAVEADGLATYIVHDDWTSPTQVREAIKELYASDPTLEGIVLVGDVPVAMVRNGQHMTTAFKMDEEKYPFIDSSVPSDRFYDCLDLEFRYLKQDSSATHLFYYELTEDCPQKLDPTFYSARIRYPQSRGGDKYEEISMFLDKAARAKAEMKEDRVDRVVSFNGHGYNSDCLMAWMDEEKAYREHFPGSFKTSTGFKHWNFRMMEPMKDRIFTELERPGIDLFMFHEHGAPTTQYINGYGETTNHDDRLFQIKAGIYSRIEREVRKGNDEAEVVAAFAKKYALTPDFFKDLHNPEFHAKDSLGYASKDIQADEFHHRVTMPRMVMFDACYNGSFHEDDYIAGEYLFNPGATVVTQGNTRNVLQDRWTIEMIGLLSHGVRAGQYNRLVATLEGHMMGDPTMRFAPLEPNTLSADMTVRKEDKDYWESLLTSPHADVQSIALRMLSAIGNEAEMSPRLLEVFRTSPFNTTRMEALKLLSGYCNDDFKEAVRLGVNDPYERIARMSADMAGDIGDVSLLPAVVDAYIGGSERQRVNYLLQNSLSLFPHEEVEKCIDRHYATAGRYKADEEKETVMKIIDHAHDFASSYHKRIIDSSLDDARRISAIRLIRNNPYHYNLDSYLAVLADTANSDAVRVNMAEALGWFTLSHRKSEIVDFCRKLAVDPATSPAVAAELRQTVNRLK